MAMGTCRECGAQISTEAKTCPKCGASKPVIPIKPPKKPASKLLIGVLAAAVVGTIAITKINGDSKKEMEAAESVRVAALSPTQRQAEEDARKKRAEQAAAKKTADDKADAISKAKLEDIGLAEVTCQMAAEKAANDPSSIDWLRQERKFFYTAADNSKAVSIQPMRAKNAMGGLIRTAVKCDLVKENTRWSVAKMSEPH